MVVSLNMIGAAEGKQPWMSQAEGGGLTHLLGSGESLLSYLSLSCRPLRP